MSPLLKGSNSGGHCQSTRPNGTGILWQQRLVIGGSTCWPPGIVLCNSPGHVLWEGRHYSKDRESLLLCGNASDFSVPVNVSHTTKEWLHRGLESLLSLKWGIDATLGHSHFGLKRCFTGKVFAESAFVPSHLEYTWNISCASACCETPTFQARRAKFRRLVFSSPNR